MMDKIASSIVINAERDALFDLFTTARYWPYWHEACLKVGGVTERPYRLGDRIFDYNRFGDRFIKVFWTIVEHDRPSLAVMQLDESGPYARVSYSFDLAEDGCLFTRELQYRPGELAQGRVSIDDVKRQMEAESDRAMKQIKLFFEKILLTEKVGFE